VQSFLIAGEPALLLISTGNISNADLEKVLRANLPGIEAAYVVLDRKPHPPNDSRLFRETKISRKTELSALWTGQST